MKTKSYISAISNIGYPLLLFAKKVGIYSLKVIFGWFRDIQDENYTNEVGLNELKYQAEKKKKDDKGLLTEEKKG